MKTQYKMGAIISYINIVLNMAISVFIIPYLISFLGASEYGVYKIVQSFAGQLSIMSFGVSTLVVRYVVFYNTRNEIKEKENFLFFAKLITYVLVALTIVIGIAMLCMIEPLYQNSLTSKEITTAKILMFFLVCNMAVNILGDVYNGTLNAYELFSMTNAIKTFKLIFRTILMFVLLNVGVKSIGIVCADLIASLIGLVVTFIYEKLKIKEKATFHYVDKKLIKECMLFAIAIFLQTIINQVNQNLDNIILGVMTSAECVTIYSIGLTVFTTFNSLVTTVGTLFGPKAVRLVAKEASAEELTDFVIKPGRLQFLIAGLIICGFILFGKQFIELWVGSKYMSVYPITVLLLVSSAMPLAEDVTTSQILNAMMKRMGRSVILIAMCVVNVGVSIICIKIIGFAGAAIGTAVSFILGYGVLLNIYLKKVAGLNIKRIFVELFGNTLPGIGFALIAGIPLTYIQGGILSFIIKIVLYAVMYFIIVYYFSMNEDERKICRQTLRSMNKGKKV